MSAALGTHAPADFVCVLTARERESLRRVAARLQPADELTLDDSELLTRIDVARRHVPERIARLFSEFRRKSNLYGTLLLRNLPIDEDLPPTPEDGRSVGKKSTHLSEMVLLLMMSHLGDVIAYADEKQGALVQDVVPVRGNEAKQENTGSTLLEFHTEDGFHPYKPDYLGLICLRRDHEGKAATYTASIRRAIELVPSRAVEVLRQPLFQIRFSSSFSLSGGLAKKSNPMPVLTGDLRDPDMCMDFFAMEAMTRAAQYALDALKEALKQVAIDMRAIPGDLMVIDNRLAVHGRSSFTPRYDGQDRWLQRAFVVRDLRRSRASRPSDSHVCTPLFVEFAEPADVTAYGDPGTSSDGRTGGFRFGAVT